IHLMENFGALIFDQQVPQLLPQAIPAFEAGKSTFAVQTSQPLEIDVSLTANEKTQHFKSSQIANNQIVVPIATADAKVLFGWEAKAGEKYFYRSPRLSLNAQSAL